ncbi:MAG: AAA family ATPase [Patescibacteria group bacterium]
MHLTRIEIQGFKSFADKTTVELPVKTGERQLITAVVGPNGSGKSNIADSIRWVLGEQSAKVVRGKKSEDVIFFGSASRGHGSMAEVSLLFNNEDGAFPVDRPEIRIGRRLYRDGTSEYVLNGEVSRLSDIQMLLTKAKVGRESYSVVAQGMIDHLLLMGGSERKTFFDEATGVRHLQIKKDQSLRKLDTTGENLAKAKLLLEEIGPRLRSLTRQVKRLEEKETLEKELLEFQKKYFSSVWCSLEEERARWEQTLKQVEADLAQKDAAILETEKAMGTLEKEETQSATVIRLQREYRQALEERQTLREKEFSLRSAMVSKSGKKTIDIESAAADLRGAHREYKDILKELENAQSIADLARLKNAFAAHAERLEKILARISSEPTEEENKETAAPLEALRKELEAADAKIARIQKELSDTNRKEESQKSVFFTRQKEFFQKQNERREVERRHSDIKIELAKIDVRRSSLLSELSAGMKERAEEIKQLPAAMSAAEAQALLPDIERLKRQLEWIGGIDPEIIKEYGETKERHEFLETQCRDLDQTIQSLLELARDLEVKIQTQFKESFALINERFDAFFKILFSGGQSKLVLTSEAADEKEDEQTSAAPEAQESAAALEAIKAKLQNQSIEIHATPPGKKIKNISMLSGGEKALTSVALISAILSVNPPPFLLLDEVDAALDESNSMRFAKILSELAARTQLIVVTHNRATMQAADFLYGVTMGKDGASKLLSIKLEEGLELARP